jgi:hypothetical protein
MITNAHKEFRQFLGMECVIETLWVDDHNVLAVFTGETTFGYLRKFVAKAYTSGNTKRVIVDYGPRQMEDGLYLTNLSILDG